MKAYTYYPVQEQLKVIHDDSAPPELSAAEQVVVRQNLLSWLAKRGRTLTQFKDDGILSFISYKNHILRGRYVPYEYFLAQELLPEQFGRLGIHTVGVGGLIVIEDRVVFATRSQQVTTYAGYLELVPSGGIDRSVLKGSGEVDYREQLIREFEEETDAARKYVSLCEPFGVLQSDKGRVHNICMRIGLTLSLREFNSIFQHSAEYSQPQFVALSELGHFVKANAKQLIPANIKVLRSLKLIK